MDAEDIRFSPENLAALIELADKGVINSTVAKEVFGHVFAEDADPKRYVQEHGLRTVQDEGALHGVVEQVIGFLVGQTMKAMKGKADPGAVKEMLKGMLAE